MADSGVIKIAIFAVGGQGGGVLSNWIVQLAQANDWAVQSTAVAGVAQRTGATFYYIEMAPPSARRPVFALAPSEADVDVVIAAELMEAGRAIMRGFVTPDKTTLIASEHRMLAVSEKVQPGNGISSPEDVKLAANLGSQDLVMFDMEQIAREAGTVASASLFGALAGSQRLPFSIDSFRQTIQQSGRGAEASRRAFDRAFDLSQQTEAVATAGSTDKAGVTVVGPEALQNQWRTLLERAQKVDADQSVLQAAMRKVVDYQDLKYGTEYLDQLESLAARDKHQQFTNACVRHLANAMCYDDVIRVADLKTRESRSQRINIEYAADSDKTVLQVTEFMHPRAQEIVSMLPVRIADALEKRPAMIAWLDRRVNKGRRLRSDRVLPFFMLYTLGGMRRWRRSLARHRQETTHIKQWLSVATDLLDENYDLAVEVINCRRLIKGYSDTHERGHSRFSQLLDIVPRLRSQTDAADTLRELISLALANADGVALAAKLEQIKTSTGDPAVVEAPIHQAK